MSRNSGDLQGRRILLLEDDVLIALDMEDFLTDLGCVVVGPFSSVAAAAEHAESDRLDAAVVDLNLRGELSVPVIDILRQRGVPTVVCSGYAELAGVKDILKDLPMVAKPCDFHQLGRLLMARLARSERRQTAES